MSEVFFYHLTQTRLEVALPKILERALYTILDEDLLVADIMKKPFNEFTVFPKKENVLKANIRKLISRI